MISVFLRLILSSLLIYFKLANRTVNRIGSVCKNDVGGSAELDGIFMTFIKKQIECAKEGSLKFTFDNLVAVSNPSFGKGSFRLPIGEKNSCASQAKKNSCTSQAEKKSCASQAEKNSCASQVEKSRVHPGAKNLVRIMHTR